MPDFLFEKSVEPPESSTILQRGFDFLLAMQVGAKPLRTSESQRETRLDSGSARTDLSPTR